MSTGALFLMGVFAVTVVIDMPIAFGLVLSCLAYLAVYDSAPMMVAAQQYVVGLDSFTLARLAQIQAKRRAVMPPMTPPPEPTPRGLQEVEQSADREEA